MSILNSANIIFDGETITSNQVSTSIDQILTITKSVDKTNALSGQILVYTVIINNPNDYAVTDIVFTDPYDDTQVTYVDNSFTVNGTQTTPDTTNPITYTITSIEALGSVTITFEMLVS